MVTKQIEQSTTTERLTTSYEDYLTLETGNRLVEWVDGEAIFHMPVRYEHQLIVQFLFKLISEYAALFDLGIAGIAPFEVKLWPDGPSREPDMFFVQQENVGRMSSKRLSGPPDLAVEVISPSSLYRDRDEKYREYAQAGVTEYWIIDSRPGRQRADFYRLTEAGHYQLFATEDDTRVKTAVLPGFWLNPAWLWQEPSPSTIALLYNMSEETAAAIQSQLVK